MPNSIKCPHCENWIGPMQVHEDCARKQGEKRKRAEGERQKANPVRAMSATEACCSACGHPMRMHAGGIGDRCAGDRYIGGDICTVCVG